MAKTKVAIQKRINEEVEIDVDDVVKFIEFSTEEEYEAIRVALEVPERAFPNLTEETNDLLETIDNLTDDEKLRYFLENMDEISYETLQEVVGG